MKTFHFAVDGPVPDYRAGQSLQMTVPVPDGRRPVTRRSFTISSSPPPVGFLQITVKRNPTGTVSNYLHDAVNVDDQWQGLVGRINETLLAEALGDFVPELIYLCGPPPMMETAIRCVGARRIDQNRVRTEDYGKGG